VDNSPGSGSFMADARQWMQARLQALVSSQAISLGGFTFCSVNTIMYQWIILYHLNLYVISEEILWYEFELFIRSFWHCMGSIHCLYSEPYPAAKGAGK
jgi:hypothetical protein